MIPHKRESFISIPNETTTTKIEKKSTVVSSYKKNIILSIFEILYTIRTRTHFFFIYFIEITKHVNAFITLLINSLFSFLKDISVLEIMICNVIELRMATSVIPKLKFQ